MQRRKLVYFVSFITFFVVFLLVFIFDKTSNFGKHQELNRTILRLESNIAKSKGLINNEYTYNELLRDSLLFEHYVREQLNMKMRNDVVFVLVDEEEDRHN